MSHSLVPLMTWWLVTAWLWLRQPPTLPPALALPLALALELELGLGLELAVSLGRPPWVGPLEEGVQAPDPTPSPGPGPVPCPSPEAGFRLEGEEPPLDG